jgi:hypothetical protein
MARSSMQCGIMGNNWKEACSITNEKENVVVDWSYTVEE